MLVQVAHGNWPILPTIYGIGIRISGSDFGVSSLTEKVFAAFQSTALGLLPLMLEIVTLVGMRRLEKEKLLESHSTSLQKLLPGLSPADVELEQHVAAVLLEKADFCAFWQLCFLASIAPLLEAVRPYLQVEYNLPTTFAWIAFVFLIVVASVTYYLSKQARAPNMYVLVSRKGPHWRQVRDAAEKAKSSYRLVVFFRFAVLAAGVSPAILDWCWALRRT